MRAVDKWTGIPLTFCLTGLQRMLRLIVPERKKPLQRILFIELSEMGSTILVDPYG